MWLAKLKKKKMQNILLGIIFAISIAMICVSTVLTVVSANFATKYYEGDSTPDILTITTNSYIIPCDLSTHFFNLFYIFSFFFFFISFISLIVLFLHNFPKNYI